MKAGKCCSCSTPPITKTNKEWVYNGTDIDGSKLIWARDL